MHHFCTCERILEYLIYVFRKVLGLLNISLLDVILADILDSVTYTILRVLKEPPSFERERIGKTNEFRRFYYERFLLH